MPSIEESLDSQSPLNASLRAGIDAISQSQEITFTKYIRVILPLDGFVFWVKADLLTASALLNAAKFNAWAPNQVAAITPAPTIAAKGSFHYGTDQRQNEDETIAVNRVIFTSTQEIQDFNEIGANVMYLGTFEGIRFAFNKRGSYYSQAAIYHYAGDALYPALESQIIDDPRAFDSKNVVVSNSLPVWLGLNQFMPMYPSFLVDANILPPYASVHIDPASTQAIQSAPSFDASGSHYQLVQEKVKITIYGLRNFSALDFQDYIFQYSLNTDIIGIMNSPVIRDEKRVQSELNILAMKKSIEFEVNYYQTRVNDVARQLILEAFIAFAPITSGE